ncbi:protein of unknown function (plasmid) [Lactiplantibacillus plantarum]
MVKVGLFEKNQHNHRLKDSLATYIYKQYDTMSFIDVVGYCGPN